MKFILILFLLFVTGCTSGDYPPYPDTPNPVGKASSVLEGYSIPTDKFFINTNEVVLSDIRPIYKLSLTVDYDSFVYQYGYVFYNGKWNMYKFDQETYKFSQWIDGYSSTTLSIDKNEFYPGNYYVLAYGCKKINDQWDCNDNQWMMHKFSVTHETERICYDNNDNDGDGLKDCEDSDCDLLICGDGQTCIDSECSKELPPFTPSIPGETEKYLIEGNIANFNYQESYTFYDDYCPITGLWECSRYDGHYVYYTDQIWGANVQIKVNEESFDSESYIDSYRNWLSNSNTEWDLENIDRQNVIVSSEENDNRLYFQVFWFSDNIEIIINFYGVIDQPNSDIQDFIKTYLNKYPSYLSDEFPPNPPQPKPVDDLIIEEDLGIFEYDYKQRESCMDSNCEYIMQGLYDSTYDGVDSLNVAVAVYGYDISADEFYNVVNIEWDNWHISDWNGQPILIVSKDSQTKQDALIIWYSDNKMIYTSFNNWDPEVIDDEVFEEVIEAYLEKYPSSINTNLPNIPPKPIPVDSVIIEEDIGVFEYGETIYFIDGPTTKTDGIYFSSVGGLNDVQVHIVDFNSKISEDFFMDWIRPRFSGVESISLNSNNIILLSLDLGQTRTLHYTWFSEDKIFHISFNNWNPDLLFGKLIDDFMLKYLTKYPSYLDISDCSNNYEPLCLEVEEVCESKDVVGPDGTIISEPCQIGIYTFAKEFDNGCEANNDNTYNIIREIHPGKCEDVVCCETFPIVPDPKYTYNFVRADECYAPINAAGVGFRIVEDYMCEQLCGPQGCLVDGCVEDKDGDGYGLGCQNGPDCDDLDYNLNVDCSSNSIEIYSINDKQLNLELDVEDGRVSFPLIYSYGQNIYFGNVLDKLNLKKIDVKKDQYFILTTPLEYNWEPKSYIFQYKGLDYDSSETTSKLVIRNIVTEKDILITLRHSNRLATFELDGYPFIFEINGALNDDASLIISGGSPNGLIVTKNQKYIQLFDTNEFSLQNPLEVRIRHNYYSNLDVDEKLDIRFTIFSANYDGIKLNKPYVYYDNYEIFDWSSFNDFSTLDVVSGTKLKYEYNTNSSNKIFIT